MMQGMMQGHPSGFMPK